MGLAVGTRPARLAHRVLGDGGGDLGPAFEIHGGGLDLVFPHHENEVAQSRALGHPFAPIWAHNGMLRFTGEKMSKSLGNVDDDPRGARRVGARDAARLLPRPRTGASRSTSRTRRWRRRLRGARRCGTRSRSAGAACEEARWEAFAAALDDDFDTPAALAVLHEWAAARQLELLERGSRSSGSARSPCATRRRPRSSSSPSGGRSARAGARLRDLGPAARRARRRSAGRCATSRAAATRSFRDGDARPRLRAPGRARGAARPPRGARGLGDRARRQGRAVARRGAAEGRSSTAS